MRQTRASIAPSLRLSTSRIGGHPTPTTIARLFSTTRPHLSNNQPPTSTLAAQAIDNAIEQIQELYGTARDEFEMAVEETEKETIYAAEDRRAAREALDNLLEYYNNVVVQGKDAAVAEVVKNRVGQRIRELEQAVCGLEQSVVDKGS